MINEAFKLVLGSICVYVLVAACSVTAQNNGERGGFAGESGRQVGESGSGNVISDVGNDILNPIPAAEAAEDGSRIVNVYQSTEDGLRTPAGLYDKQLKINCYFQIASDGKNRCLPLTNSASFYSSSLCSDSSRVAIFNKGSCAPEFISVVVVPDNKCPLSYKYKIYNAGAKIVVPAIDFSSAVIYSRSGASCVSTLLSAYSSFDFYTVGSEIPPTNYVEGFLTHG